MKLMFALLTICGFLFQTDDFAFTKGNSKIVLTIDENARNFTWNKPSILRLRTTNIDAKGFAVSAIGLTRDLSNDDDLSTWKITPTRKSIKTDTLRLNVRFYQGESAIFHTFKIPIEN